MKTKQILTTIAAAAMLTLSALPAQAIPAWPGKLTKQQPDGTVLTYRVVGDEHCHALVTDDGYEVAADADGALRYVSYAAGQRLLMGLAHDAASRTASETAKLSSLNSPLTPSNSPLTPPKKTMARLAADGFPTTGNVRGLVLLVEFQDREFQADYGQDTFRQLLNDAGYAQYGAQGSARDFFVDQSNGLFTPTFDVAGPLKLSKPMANYGGDDDQGYDAGAGDMVREACQMAHDQGTDFSQYDYNNDGRVDFVYVVYAGYGQQYGAPAETIWPHTANLTDWGIELELDGKQVGRYACGSELKYNSGTQLEGIGTFCHEFGHVLGLPDFYDTRHANSTRIGLWSVMDQGCYLNESRTPCAYSAFERMSLGWMTLTDLTEPSDNVQLPELTKSLVAYRVPTSRPDEYFVLENRQQQGWDAYQPARGMLIYHVDYDKDAWDQNTVNNGSNMRYDLMEADGLMSRDTYATDVFPSKGNDRFTDNSTPSALMRDGTPTRRPLISIRDVGGTINFRYMQEPLPRPDAPSVSDVTDHSLTAQWTPISGAQGYRLQAREVLTAEENPVVADETFEKLRTGSYGVPDEGEMGAVLDSYLSQEGWSGSGLHQAGGRLHIAEGGSLSSPLLDLSEPEGRFTVALRAMAAPEQEATFSVKATRNNGKELSAAGDLHATSDAEHEIIISMTEGIGRTRLVLTATEGDLYISRLRIVKDHVDGSDVWAEVGHTVTASDITGNSYTLSGLLAQKTYALTLTALSDDEELSSLPSPEVLVSTKAEGEGIADPFSSAPQLSNSYYNIMGQRTSSATKGLKIVRTGTVTKKVVL